MQEEGGQSQASQDVINMEHAQLRALIGSMGDGVIATDTEGKVTMYNGAALSVLDSNQALEGTYIGNSLRLLDQHEQPIDATRLVIDARSQIISRDFRLRYSDGSLVNIYLSIAPVRPGFGSEERSGFVLLLRDITHEKSLEEEREEFISVVSHELRTPVTIAEGNLSNAMIVLDNGGDFHTVNNAVHQAHDQVMFLSSLINDLATLSRAENGGEQKINVVSINVHQLIHTLAQNYVNEVEKKNLVMHTEVDPSLELLHNSNLYVREILQNFITNAIKYTEHGSITLGAKPHEDGVMFTVTDTGIGISINDQEQLFNKFFRSEDFRTRKSSGTGLGLYVTRKLAKIIGAKISLQSTLNKGSTFSIYVPNMHPATQQAEPATQSQA